MRSRCSAMASEQLPGWEGLKAYAKSKAVGSEAPVVGATGLPTPTKRVDVLRWWTSIGSRVSS